MGRRFSLLILVLAVGLSASAGRSQGQVPIPGTTFSFKIYRTNSALYPFVQSYIRVFNQEMEPVENINIANIGVMVKGRAYDPSKSDFLRHQAQYSIETLQNRPAEGFRTVIVWDCSKTMAGQPFADANRAITNYIQSKRPSDQVAILAIRDRKEGYQLVSQFEKDAGALFQRMGDVACDGVETHLYDTVAAALEMCASASQGGETSSDVNFAVLNVVVVISDGKDEGSSVERGELMARISGLKIPVPIYSLGYSKQADAEKGLKNLQALSRNTFGKYWGIGETKEFSKVTEKIHFINRNDYVLTFRSYLEIDGESHPYKIGITYPAGTNKFGFDSGSFEAIDAEPMIAATNSQKLRDLYEQMKKGYPALPNPPGPYLGGLPAGAAAPPGAAGESKAPAELQKPGAAGAEIKAETKAETK